MHVVPTGEASPNVTVVDEAEQLGTKYGDFLHDLTLFALVSVEASADQRLTRGRRGSACKIDGRGNYSHPPVSFEGDVHLSRSVEGNDRAESSEGRSLAPELDKHVAP